MRPSGLMVWSRARELSGSGEETRESRLSGGASADGRVPSEVVQSQYGATHRSSRLGREGSQARHASGRRPPAWDRLADVPASVTAPLYPGRIGFPDHSRVPAPPLVLIRHRPIDPLVLSNRPIDHLTIRPLSPRSPIAHLTNRPIATISQSPPLPEAPNRPVAESPNPLFGILAIPALPDCARSRCLV